MREGLVPELVFVDGLRFTNPLGRWELRMIDDAAVPEENTEKPSPVKIES